MKKVLLQNLSIKKRLLATLLVAAFIFIGTKSQAQCIAPTNSPTGTITVSPYIQTCLSGNMLTGNYTSFSVTAAGQYAILTSFGTFVTVTDNANTPLASGFGVALYTGILTPGVYRVHIYNTAGCATGGGSRIVCVAPRNNAFSFDGVNDYIDLGTAITTSLTGKDKLTVEAWVSPNSNTGVHSIVGNHQGPTQFELRTTNNNFEFFIGFGSFGVTSVATVTLNTWTHVVGVFDQNKISIYVNGVSSGTTAVTSFSFPVSSVSTKIGLDGFSSEFDGAIDEVRIWNRALCQGEILNNKNGPIPTSNSGLIANYHFNQGVGGGSNPTVTSLVDDSGNNINGTVMNAALTGASSNWIGSGSYPDNGSLAPFVSPNISITGTNTVCSGSSATLTASGVNTYTWVSGPSTASNVVSPTVTTTYSVTGTNSLGCISNMAQQTVSVNALPIVTVNSGSICNTTSFTMTPSGASTYTFSSGSAVVSPTTTTSYTVIGTSTLGCSASAVSNVTVNTCAAAAALDLDGSNDFVNLGTAITTSLVNKDKLTVEAWVYPKSNTGTHSIVGNHQGPTQFELRTNGNNFNFFIGFGSFGVTSVATVTLNTWTHVVGVFDQNKISIYVNGVSSGTTAVTSFSFPVSSVTTKIGLDAFSSYFNGGVDEVRIWDRALCQGEIVNNMNGEIPTTASGLMANYHFNQGLAAQPNPTVTSLSDVSGNAYTGTLTGFALTGATSNWIAPGAVTGNAPAFVSPTISANSGSICSGNSFTIMPTGASTYTYSSGSAIVSPTATASYSVTGTNSLGCVASNTAVSSVTVNATPVINVNSGSICSGSSFTMMPTGASTYTYSSGSAVVSPTSTASYSVNGTDANGCVSAASAVSNVTVNALPIITVNSGSICSGSSFTMTPTGASTYTYSSGSAAVSPTATASYSVNGTDANGCVSAASAVSNVTVNPLPTINASTSSTIICTLPSQQTATLTSTGAITYTWSTAATGSSTAVSPSVTSTYTVTGTDANGCTNTAMITQSVATCAGITEYITGNGASVYPNPNNGVFTVYIQNVTNSTTISVINVLGQVILNKQAVEEKTPLNLQALENGIYFIVINSGSSKQTIKIVKQ